MGVYKGVQFYPHLLQCNKNIVTASDCNTYMYRPI